MNDEHDHDFHIKVNSRERVVEHAVLTYQEVVTLSNLPPLKEGMEYIVTYKHAEAPKHDGDLIEGETVTVRNGTEFVVEPSNRS